MRTFLDELKHNAMLTIDIPIFGKIDIENPDDNTVTIINTMVIGGVIIAGLMLAKSIVDANALESGHHHLYFQPFDDLYPDPY